jgi:DNA polymerase-3 subunit gamma/tau
VFENVIGQEATNQLRADIKAGMLAPSMLFEGPAASGKGTSALELGRVLSCEKDADWGCDCPSCSKHKLLLHPDLLCLGPRPFSSEIAASAGSFLRDPHSQPARRLFIRSVRKLLLRFNPALWEDEPKGAKISPLVNALSEELDELDFSEEALLPRLTNKITESAYKLESAGVADNIPIGQVRRAAYWGRLAPAGRKKLLVIENADNMQDEARNSLLKLLEEPSARLHCLLCSSRPGSLLPTVLSRLRPYRFQSRSPDLEDEVIRRVFRETSVNEAQGINNYLQSFLPVSQAELEGLASYFAASVAYKAALLSKKKGRPLSQESGTEAFVILGRYSAPRAQAAGFGRPSAAISETLDKIMEKAQKFEIRSLFPRFLSCTLQEFSSALGAAPFVYEMWGKYINYAASAAGVYNLRPSQVLEKLFLDLSRGMAGL